MVISNMISNDRYHLIMLTPLACSLSLAPALTPSANPTLFLIYL